MNDKIYIVTKDCGYLAILAACPSFEAAVKFIENLPHPWANTEDQKWNLVREPDDSRLKWQWHDEGCMTWIAIKEIPLIRN